MQPMNQISGQIVKKIVANENIPGGVFAAFAIFDELLPLSYPSYLLPPLPPLLHLSLPNLFLICHLSVTRIRKTTKKRRKSKLTFCLQVDHQ